MLHAFGSSAIVEVANLCIHESVVSVVCNLILWGILQAAVWMKESMPEAWLAYGHLCRSFN